MSENSAADAAPSTSMMRLCKIMATVTQQHAAVINQKQREQNGGMGDNSYADWNVAQELVHEMGLILGECRASRTQWS